MAKKKIIPEQPTSTQLTTRQVFFVVCFIIIIIAGIGKISNKSSDGNSRSESSSEPYAYFKAKDFVEAQLKYPEEANFDFTPQFERWEDNNNYRIVSYVTTKNAFGVKSKLKFFCVLHYKGGDHDNTENWDLVNLEIDDSN